MREWERKEWDGKRERKDLGEIDMKEKESAINRKRRREEIGRKGKRDK